MRAALVVVVAASLSGLARDCPRFKEDVPKRRTVGDLQYQIGTEVMTHTDLELLDAGAFLLDYDVAGHSPPGELLSFRVTAGDTRQANNSPPPFLVTIVINGITPGASEIDLDDQRAQVSARPLAVADIPYHDVTGHLSIRDLFQDYALGCPMRVSGTMDIYAVGPNGETLSFTSVTFSAADQVRDGMCINNDG